MAWGRRFFRGGVAMAVGVASTLTTMAVTQAEPAGAATPAALVATSISSAGGSVCAATEDAEVYCWGPDWNGFIGNGTGGGYSFEGSYALTPTKAQTSGVEVGMGCARTSAGAVQCWGFDGSTDGGDGTEFSNPPWGTNTPRDYGFGTATRVAGRCAIRTGGTVACQGWDNWGQLGRGGTGYPASGYALPPPSSETAVAVTGLTGVVDITQVTPTVGTNCAAKGDGTVWCWGLGQEGRLGNGQSAMVDYPCRTGGGTCPNYAYASSPVQVPGITDAVGVEESCALRANGGVSCWGANTGNRFLTSQATTAILTPTTIPAFAGAIDIEVNRTATCAVFADGRLTCQGQGLLGDGPRHTTTATVDVPRNGKAAQVIAVDNDNWCVRYTSGRIDCWGSNTLGQLGIGSRSNSNAPITTPTLTIGFTGRDLITGLLFETGTSGSTVKEREATTIRFRVENLTQETLTNVAVTGVTLTAIDEAGEGAATIGPAPGGNSMPGVLGPRSLGQHLGFQDYAVNPTKAGVVRIAATATATGPDGSVETETFTYDLTIVPAPLKVELTARPLNSTDPRGVGAALEFKLNENDHENRFEVEVKVSNQGDETVESIDYLDPEAPIDFDSLLVDDNGVPVPGVAIGPLLTDAPDLPAHDLDPGESMTQTYSFEGSGEAHAELSTIVEGRMGTQAVSGRGVVEVKILTDVLVEFGMKSSRPGPYLGGAPIRMDGVVKNVSEDISVGIIAFPTTTGNGGNGNVFCPSSGGAACPSASESYDDVLAGPPGSPAPTATAVGRTPTGPVPMVLAPGQEVPLQALLITTELPVASTATVQWEVRAWKHEVDEDTGEVTKTRAAQTQIEILDDEGLANDLAFSVPPTEPLPDVAGGECATDSLFLVYGCGALVGIGRLGQSLGDLARLASRQPVYVRMLMWAGDYLGRIAVALRDSPAAQQALVDEIVAEMGGYIDAGAAAASAATNLPALVRNAVVGFIDKWVTVLETGDYETLSFELGRLSGENPDVVLGGAALSARIGRRLLARAGLASDPVRAAVEAAEALRVANLPTDLAAAERVAADGGVAVHRSGVLHYGDAMTPSMMGDYLAADPRDIETAFRIAESEKVLLTFGSRVDEAADAVRAGTAWSAPRDLPLTAIDELDVTYLGYPADRIGFVDLAQPPRDLPPELYSNLGTIARTTDDATLASAARDWVQRNHPGLDAATAERVAARLQVRVDDFVAGYTRFVEYRQRTNGIIDVPVGNRTVGPISGPIIGDNRPLRLVGRNGDGFGPGRDRDINWINDYMDGEISMAEFNRLLAENEGFPSRLYWELSFDAPGTGQFRPLVDGGVQLLGVTARDGTRVLGEGQRARIYEKLQSMLGMRNGELADWVATGLADPLQESIADGAITVTIGPGRQARASGFVANRSAFDTLNTGASNSDFVLIAGYGHRWLAEPSTPGAYDRASHWSLLNTFLNLPRFFALQSLWKFADGLTSLQIRPSYDRDGGGNIRPDGDGGLETFVPDGAGARRASAASATTATGSWVPISVADALALGNDPDTLELAPATMVVTGLAGSTTLDVSTLDDLDVPTTSDWFVAGDRIVLDPGGPNEERVTVASVTTRSLVLVAPLTREHTPGEYVVLDTDGATATPTERFVRAAYVDLLGRAPTDAELARTAARIDGGTPRRVITTELARSTEWIGHLIDTYYTDTLGRAPDPSGRAYWINQIRTRAKTPARVAALFYSSREYYNGIGGGTREAWVTHLYQALLGRAPDRNGLAFWIDATQRHGREWTARSFVNSQESRRRRVRLLYLDLLARQPDPSGLAYWSRMLLRTGDDVTLAIELTASNEYFARA